MAASDPEINPSTTDALQDLVNGALGVRRAVMRRTGLNETELGALERVVTAPSSPSELARHLDVSTAASTGVVDRLESRGHVQRRPHPTDRRRTEVHVTSNGRAEMERQLQPMLISLNELEHQLSAAEKQTVVNFLRGAIAAFATVSDADG